MCEIIIIVAVVVVVVVGDVLNVILLMLLLGDMVLVLFEASNTFVTEAAFEVGCFWFGVFFIFAATSALVIVAIIIVVWYTSFCYYCFSTVGRGGSSIIQ